ncbi:oocyte zinc finger protein XlCOF29-like [Xenopus laevis]|uniref:Oocyte zinc finger protein XlCOF29-like n=1 Tax=Xenopus laevis TaxID=8355 RepID=A0A8J0TWF7_XENLA|nr:oocyte zinc finger protein XlCOF29-like [Xenopus laevis]OCT58378.1 hypothetical protein XELAEV_18002317mg [Xenopus laevis]
MPNCIVENCGNSSYKASEKGVKLHTFPTKLERVKLWLKAIPQKYEDLESFAQQILEAKKTNPYRVCSDHFPRECYSGANGKCILSKNAVPSVFSCLPPPAKRFCMDPAHSGWKEKPKGVDVSTRTDIYNFGRDRGTQFDRYYGVKSRKVATDPKSFTRDVATLTNPRIQTSEPQISSWGKKFKIITPRLSVNTADKYSQCNEYDFYTNQRGFFKASRSQRDQVEISEEQTDAVMGNMNNNQRNEKILNLTLEIIYLLSGEDFTVMKKSDNGVPQRCNDCMLEGLCRRHTPTVTQMSNSVIQKENDKIALELLSNIIQLLTGEEWEYLNGNKALYSAEIMDNNQQLCSRDCDYGEMREIAAHPQAALCSKAVSGKTAGTNAVGRDGCLTNPSTPKYHALEITIKEEPPSWEEENDSIHTPSKQVQGTDTSRTPGGTSANVISTSIKEEPISYEGGNHADPLRKQTQGTETTTPIMGCSSSNDSLSSTTISEEPRLCKRGNQSDAPPPNMRSSPNAGANSISDAKKEKLASKCSIDPLTGQTQGTDTPTPIMGCRMNNR